MNRVPASDRSSPNVICIALVMRPFLLAILVEDLHENIVIGGRHIHKLEADVIDGRVVWVAFAPLRTRGKGHVTLPSDLARLFDAELKIDPHRNRHGAFDLESTRANISKLTDQFTGRFIQYLHVIGEILSRQFSAFRRHDNLLTNLKGNASIVYKSFPIP